MTLMGFDHVLDDARQAPLPKPKGHLAAKFPGPPRHRAVTAPAASFAGYDQDKPSPRGVASKKKPLQSRLRVGQGHAVKVDPRLWFQLSALQVSLEFPIKIGRWRSGLGKACHVILEARAAPHGKPLRKRNRGCLLRPLRFP